MPRGDKKAIMNYPVHRLDLNTQNRATKILRVVDELIRLNNWINNNLDYHSAKVRLVKMKYQIVIKSLSYLHSISKNSRRSTNKFKTPTFLAA